jgi:hypothetical protein
MDNEKLSNNITLDNIISMERKRFNEKNDSDNDNMRKYNFDNIKIYNGTFQSNIEKIYKDKSENILSCSRNISSPCEMIHFNGGGNKNKCLDHNDINADILENIYLVYELHDDFDTNNIDVLIDLLSDTTFNITIGGRTVFEINLAISCVFENENPILYIQSDILQYQIQNGECNIDNHQYKELIEKCMLIYKKFIIMPISFIKFIDYIICGKIKYHHIRYIYGNINKILYNFIKSINLSEQSISLATRNAYNSTQNILTLKTHTYKLDKLISQIICKMPDSCIYFTIKISPNYEEIDKNLWSEAIYMLPNINFISYFDKKITSNEMLIRTTKNCHIYFYFMDQKLKYVDPIERTKNILKKYYEQPIPTQIYYVPPPISYDNIIFEIDTPQISINVNISFYSKKEIMYVNGLYIYI